LGGAHRVSSALCTCPRFSGSILNRDFHCAKGDGRGQFWTALDESNLKRVPAGLERRTLDGVVNGAIQELAASGKATFVPISHEVESILSDLRENNLHHKKVLNK